MGPAGLRKMGKAPGLHGWSWQQQVLLTVAGLYSMSRGHQTSCKPWQALPCLGAQAFPFCKTAVVLNSC